ncbi:XisI protein [Spirosoma soli]|uniref:XisI protein n=1 Tax=Spirosoma soli TaxID=1770529 RepID=A0ABW5M3W6_9BACT
MEKIDHYRQSILAILNDYLHIIPVNLQDVENQLIIDTERNHYQFVSIGWDKKAFSYAIIYHFDIKPDGKIRIQVNNTDRDVAEELEQMGVPKSDIVIGFQPPQYRQYTGYAVA